MNIDIERTGPANMLFYAQEQLVSRLVESYLCPKCGLSGVIFKVVPEIKFRFSAKSCSSCISCEDFSQNNFLCQRFRNSNMQNVPFDIKTRTKLAFRGIACGFLSMQEWASIMNMPFFLSQNAKTHITTYLSKVVWKHSNR